MENSGEECKESSGFGMRIKLLDALIKINVVITEQFYLILFILTVSLCGGTGTDRNDI